MPPRQGWSSRSSPAPRQRDGAPFSGTRTTSRLLPRTLRTITEGSLCHSQPALSAPPPAPAPIISHHRGPAASMEAGATQPEPLFPTEVSASLLPKISQQQRPSIPELPARPPTKLPPTARQGLHDLLCYPRQLSIRLLISPSSFWLQASAYLSGQLPPPHYLFFF